MRIYTKKSELTKLYGKTKWFENTRGRLCTYSHGILPFDEKNYVKKAICFFVRRKALEIRIPGGFFFFGTKASVVIPNEDLVSVFVEQSQYHRTKQERGWLDELTLPWTSLIITYRDEEGEQREAVFDCRAKDSRDMAFYFQKFYTKQYVREQKRLV